MPCAEQVYRTRLEVWVTGEGIPERRWLGKVKDDNYFQIE